MGLSVYSACSSNKKRFHWCDVLCVPSKHCPLCKKRHPRAFIDLSCFPRDFFFSSRTYQPHNKKLLLLNRGQKLPYGIALEEYHNCCHETVNVTEYFFANVSLDRKLISLGTYTKLSVYLGIIKSIFSKYYTSTDIFLLTMSLIPLPASNEISSDMRLKM